MCVCGVGAEDGTGTSRSSMGDAGPSVLSSGHWRQLAEDGYVGRWWDRFQSRSFSVLFFTMSSSPLTHSTLTQCAQHTHTALLHTHSTLTQYTQHPHSTLTPLRQYVWIFPTSPASFAFIKVLVFCEVFIVTRGCVIDF